MIFSTHLIFIANAILCKLIWIGESSFQNFWNWRLACALWKFTSFSSYLLDALRAFLSVGNGTIFVALYFVSSTLKFHLQIHCTWLDVVTNRSMTSPVSALCQSLMDVVTFNYSIFSNYYQCRCVSVVFDVRVCVSAS